MAGNRWKLPVKSYVSEVIILQLLMSLKIMPHSFFQDIFVHSMCFLLTVLRVLGNSNQFLISDYGYLCINFHLGCLYRDIFAAMTTATYDFAGFYMVIMTKHSEDCHQIVRKIFQDLWTLHIANAILLIPTEDYDTILLYTFFPFNPSKCETVEPVVFDYYENRTFAINASLFPKKFQNFYKCPLKISTYHLPPYMILEETMNNLYEMDGIEGKMIKLMSQRLNFTPIVLLSSTNTLRKVENVSTAVYAPKLKRSLDLVNKFVHTYSSQMILVKL